MPPTVRYSSSLGEASITDTPTPAMRTVASSDTPDDSSGGGRDETLVRPCERVGQTVMRARMVRKNHYAGEHAILYNVRECHQRCTRYSAR